ncbi:MAG: HlyD family efflux transporter periplasmic adaptor subunit [Oscillospiraceae bacterium]
MTEQKVKKRGWVKNAAIIFLAVMLVLTFFSNTIMNRSLPEVAVQYVQSGTITAKIRGSGTVTANESYEVKTAQARKVLSVPVKVGDEVKVGDTLVLFADAESTQIKEAQDALDAAVLAYKKKLIDATGGADYAKENRDIQIAQKNLDKAKADRLANAVTAQDLATAEQNVNTATTESEIQKAKVDALAEQLSGMTPPNDTTDYPTIRRKQAELAAAKAELPGVELTYKDGYDNLVNHANAWMKSINLTPAQQNAQRATYIKALSGRMDAQIPATNQPENVNLPYQSNGKTVTVPLADAKAMVEAYTSISTLQDKITTLTAEINALSGSGITGDWNYNTVKTQLKEAREKQATIDGVLKRYQANLQTVKDKFTKWEAADKAVDDNQSALETAMFTLSEKRKADGKAQATESLDLADMKSKMDKQSKLLSELKAGGTGAVVKSEVNGIVKTINVTAGNTTDAATPLAVVEVPDRGFGLTFSVTTEQSKKLKMGDEAEITSNYWGGDKTTATLVGIKSDPEKPGTNKLLVFKLEGDVESGAQMSISIGERGANYEAIIPSSALRSDSNGSFVLAVMPKSSPLGNRYIAQRVDVKVLASDDKSTAVSGGITSSDMVVTTSTKPIEPGTQVRLPDAG